MDIKGALNRIVNQLDLTTEEMQAVMRQIMTGQCTDAQIGAFGALFRATPLCRFRRRPAI